MIVVAVIFIVSAVITAAKKHPDTTIPYVILIGMVVGLTFYSTFILTEETMRGAPLHSIEPGRYTVIEVVEDRSFSTDHYPATTYLVLRDSDGKVKFYLLPTNELKGIPAEGGILEVSKIPSSTKMVFQK